MGGLTYEFYFCVLPLLVPKICSLESNNSLVTSLKLLFVSPIVRL